MSKYAAKDKESVNIIDYILRVLLGEGQDWD